MKIIEWILSHFRKEEKRLQDYVPDDVIEWHKANAYRQMAIEKLNLENRNNRMRESLKRHSAFQYAQFRIIRQYIEYTDKMIKMLKSHGGNVPAGIVEFNKEIKQKLNKKGRKNKV
jgi:hypothetical protein